MNRTKRTHPRRLLSLLLAWLLCLSCMQPAFAANETATTVQMMKTEGTVSVTNNSGKSVSQRDKMRLYNGYHVETEETSYAWLNLDSSKLSKLDAVSEMELRKSGKKLELLLNSGNLFFNVTEPLEEEETLNIRTSTMVVGIRGTCGWVRVIDRWNTEVYLLEGQVECRVSDPVTGEIKSTILTAGETARFVVYPQDRQGDKCDIIKDRFTEGDIPGFVLVELVKDVELCDRIYEDSGLDILGHLAAAGGGDPSGKLPSGDAATPEAIAEAERQLKEDEAETARKLTDIREQEEGQEHNISKDPVWKDEQDGQAKQPGGTASSSAPVMPPVTPPAAPTELTMKITDDEAQAALNGASAVNVLPSAEPIDNTLEVDSGLNVQPGKTLTLQPGINVQVLEDQPLQVDGTLDVVRGNVGNFGNLTVTSSNTLHVGGSLYNGDVINQGGQITVTATGRVVVDGTFYNYGGTLNLTRGATVKAKEFALTPMPDGWRVSDTADAEGYYTLVPETAVTASGMAGDNVFWSYTEATKTLRIWGSGPMTDFSYDYGTDETDVPWYAYVGEIETLTIEDEVEHIGDYALHMCTALKNESLPDSLTSIGSHAFYGCSGLTSITIPDGVTSIGDSAFYDCSSLTDIDLPAGLISIGNGAFYFCDGLTEINIPDGVTSIGSFAFHGCSGLTSITIPDSVTSIGNNAFEGCDRLAQINIPAGVTSIEEGTFLQCSGLTSVTISSGVTSIGDYAFASCISLTSIIIPDGVTSIGDEAFENCSSLASITIPDSVTSIGESAFALCGSLADVYYGGTRTQWNAIRIGDNNDDLLNATLHCIDDGEEPDPVYYTVTFLNEGAVYATRQTDETGIVTDWPADPTRDDMEFLGWYTAETGGTRVTAASEFRQDTMVYAQWQEEGSTPDLDMEWEYDEATRTLRIWGSGIMPNYNDPSVEEPEAPWFQHAGEAEGVVVSGLTTIGANAFNSFTNLKTVTLPDHMARIYPGAFDGCSSLTDIKIPDGIVSIEVVTFRGCSSLTTITIPDGIISIDLGAFGDC